MLPTPFDFIFRYFAFIAFGINLLNLWALRGKLTSTGKVFLALFASVFLMLGLLQIFGGYSTFFFVFLPPIQHPLVVLFWLSYFAFLWGTTGWVLFGNGATDLLQSGLISLQNTKATPHAVKILFVVLSIILPMLLVVGHTLGVFSRPPYLLLFRGFLN